METKSRSTSTTSMPVNLSHPDPTPDPTLGPPFLGHPLHCSALFTAHFRMESPRTSCHVFGELMRESITLCVYQLLDAIGKASAQAVHIQVIVNFLSFPFDFACNPMSMIIYLGQNKLFLWTVFSKLPVGKGVFKKLSSCTEGLLGCYSCL
mgnify:CR=1 FL=1